MLYLNDNKTEVLCIGKMPLLSMPGDSCLKIGDYVIKSTIEARNSSIVMDNVFILKNHVNVICKESWFHLWNIGLIRQYID